MSYRFRVYPTEQQARVFRMHCDHSRFVYNVGLEQRNLWRQFPGPSPSWIDQAKQLTEARKEFDWLRNGSVQVQQQALRDLDQAFKNWWGNPNHFRHPKFRRKNANESFNIPAVRKLARLNRKWGSVRVPKAGHVKFRLTRDFNLLKQCKSFRVKQDRRGRWWISFTCGQPEFDRTTTGSETGLDLGVASTVTTSNGNHMRMPDLLSEGESKRRLRLQRKLARQQQGSNRYEQTRLELARLSGKQVDRKKDWIEKTTTQLVRDNDFIAIENLDIQNMVRSAKGTVEKPGRNVAQKRGLNRSINAQSWGLFRRRLEDKAEATESCVVKRVDPRYTSLKCSLCGHTCKTNRKNQATFTCVACKYSVNADVNAAINILYAARSAVSGRGAEQKTSETLVEEAVGCETSIKGKTKLCLT